MKAKPQSFTVERPGVGRIGAAVSGSGPPLLLVAGLGSTMRIWGDLPRVLAPRFTVLTVDHRGVGGSRDVTPFSLEAAADDLAAVLDERGIGRCVAVGASMGGLVVAQLLATRPERLSAAVLASTAARLTSHGRRIMALMRDLFQSLPPGRVGAALMSLAFAPRFQERFPALVDTAARQYGLDPEDVPGALAQAECLLEGWDLREALSAVSVPSLVLAGGLDPIVSRHDTEELARALRTELVVVPDAAHSVLAEGGRELLERVIRFAEEHA